MRIILTLRRTLAVGLAAVSLGACRAGDSASEGKLQVVASFYPLAEAARRVGGDRVQVTDLTPPGVEPHDLELSTDAVDQLEDADVILLLGRGFQPAAEAAAKRAGAKTVEVLAEVPVEDDDPHVWLDPTLMARIIDVTQAALSDADPAGAQAFAANADAYRRQLGELDAEFRSGLATCDRRVIVTAHDAFGYLARRYGLTVEAISGLSPDAEPDPQRLAQLADEVRSQGTTTIFTETLVPADVAETLAREAGVRTAVLDPVESLSPGQESYLTAMRVNLQALRQSLGCR